MTEQEPKRYKPTIRQGYPAEQKESDGNGPVLVAVAIVLVVIGLFFLGAAGPMIGGFCGGICLVVAAILVFLVVRGDKEDPDEDVR